MDRSILITNTQRVLGVIHSKEATSRLFILLHLSDVRQELCLGLVPN